eukprot:TRINITY_DN93621_c0_g1_i1.p1 TRINITY_DN93621_c0_g1~~TRINITY_DN93621_c0_g1_i1.p1  ORF type:complete len:418 (+),score=88.88 TRINITY_DN93621_c0_g1_i1:71-1324(+)
MAEVAEDAELVNVADEDDLGGDDDIKEEVDETELEADVEPTPEELEIRQITALRYIAEHASNPNTAALDLKGRRLGECEGWAAIVDALVSCSPSAIDLTDNRMGDAEFATLLQRLRSARSINASRNSIGTQGAAATISALDIIRGVTELDLSSNNIDNEDALRLIEVLQHHSVISLSLSNNVIGSEGAVALAQRLSNASTIARLDLSFNGIGDEGASAIVAAMESGRSSVVSVDLSYNGLSNEGVTALVDAIRGNTSITSLNVADDGVDARVIETLDKKLEAHRQIRPETPIVHSVSHDSATINFALHTGSALRISSFYVEYTDGRETLPLRWSQAFELTARDGCSAATPIEFSCRAHSLQPASLYLFRTRVHYSSGVSYSDVASAVTMAPPSNVEMSIDEHAGSKRHHRKRQSPTN